MKIVLKNTMKKLNFNDRLCQKLKSFSFDQERANIFYSKKICRGFIKTDNKPLCKRNFILSDHFFKIFKKNHFSKSKKFERKLNFKGFFD